jgi:hypothetical protein
LCTKTVVTFPIEPPLGQAWIPQVPSRTFVILKEPSLSA